MTISTEFPKESQEQLFNIQINAEQNPLNRQEFGLPIGNGKHLWFSLPHPNEYQSAEEDKMFTIKVALESSPPENYPLTYKVTSEGLRNFLRTKEDGTAEVAQVEREEALKQIDPQMHSSLVAYLRQTNALNLFYEVSSLDFNPFDRNYFPEETEIEGEILRQRARNYHHISTAEKRVCFSRQYLELGMRQQNEGIVMRVVYILSHEPNMVGAIAKELTEIANDTRYNSEFREIAGDLANSKR